MGTNEEQLGKLCLQMLFFVAFGKHAEMSAEEPATLVQRVSNCIRGMKKS